MPPYEPPKPMTAAPAAPPLRGEEEKSSFGGVDDDKEAAGAGFLASKTVELALRSSRIRSA
jgi:hypothetical protein